MRRAAALAPVLLAAGLAALAQDKPCGPADVAAAEKAVDNIVSWAQLHSTFRDFRHCDRGAVDELFTDAVLRLTVEWKNVDDFADAMRKDAAFKAFVFKHLGSPAARDDLESVYSRAKASCPPNQAAFCEELAEVAKPAK